MSLLPHRQHKVCVLSPAIWPHAPPCAHTLRWLTPCTAHTQTSLTPWPSMCTLWHLLLHGRPRAHSDIPYSMALHVHTWTSITLWPSTGTLWHVLPHGHHTSMYTQLFFTPHPSMSTPTSPILHPSMHTLLHDSPHASLCTLWHKDWSNTCLFVCLVFFELVFCYVSQTDLNLTI